MTQPSHEKTSPGDGQLTKSKGFILPYSLEGFSPQLVDSVVLGTVEKVLHRGESVWWGRPSPASWLKAKAREFCKPFKGALLMT